MLTYYILYLWYFVNPLCLHSHVVVNDIYMYIHLVKKQQLIHFNYMFPSMKFRVQLTSFAIFCICKLNPQSQTLTHISTHVLLFLYSPRVKKDTSGFRCWVHPAPPPPPNGRRPMIFNAPNAKFCSLCSRLILNTIKIIMAKTGTKYSRSSMLYYNLQHL